MRLFTLIAVLLIGTNDFAQPNEKPNESRPLNNINLNLFGDFSLVSVNYERQFLVSPSSILSIKLGLGYNEKTEPCLWGPCTTYPEKYLTIPHHITMNLGKRRHFLEFGFGGTVVHRYKPKTYLFYPIVGYRFLPLKSGKLNFRVFGLMPLEKIAIICEEQFIYISPVGLNLGISF